MIERKDAKWRKAAGAWLDAKMLMDEAKANIRKLAGEASCYGAGVKHLWNVKAGRIDYKEIPELRGVNIEEYRRPGNFESRISAI